MCVFTWPLLPDRFPPLGELDSVRTVSLALPNLTGALGTVLRAGSPVCCGCGIRDVTCLYLAAGNDVAGASLVVDDAAAAMEGETKADDEGFWTTATSLHFRSSSRWVHNRSPGSSNTWQGK